MRDTERVYTARSICTRICEPSPREGKNLSPCGTSARVKEIKPRAPVICDERCLDNSPMANRKRSGRYYDDYDDIDDDETVLRVIRGLCAHLSYDRKSIKHFRSVKVYGVSVLETGYSYVQNSLIACAINHQRQSIFNLWLDSSTANILDCLTILKHDFWAKVKRWVFMGVSTINL